MKVAITIASPERRVFPAATAICHSRYKAFTLLELLLATAIFAIVVIAINTVFFAALHLRNRATEALDESMPIQQALALMRKDLQNAVTPGGVLAGNFRMGGPATGLGSATGSSTTASGSATARGATGGGSTLGSLGGGQTGGLDFFTSTAQVRNYVTGGDIQEVNYQLMEAADGQSALGKDLVRSITRNLLAFSAPQPEEQRLASNIESLDFEFYDGLEWRNTWDTTMGDAGLPMAVRVKLMVAVDPNKVSGKREPVEMVVRLPSTGTNSISGSTNTVAMAQ